MTHNLVIPEEEIQQVWNINKTFNKSIDQNNQSEYIFYDGPPFATGLPHYGHILAGFIKDTISRYQTECGKSVPRKGGWDCIAAGTKINLYDGTDINIEDIKKFMDQHIELDVLSYNGYDGITHNKITGFYDKGYRECIEITFENGNKLICTPEHKILTKNGYICACDLNDMSDIISSKINIINQETKTTNDIKYSTIVYTKIITKRVIGMMHVYDISVDNTHNFIANSIIVHNCHGLPIEYEIEKKYSIRTRQEIEEWGIENYNNACRNIVMSCATDWKKIMNRLGRWIDFKHDYKTMDFDFMNSVWWVFSKLASKGLIYSSYKVVPYSVACKTPLSNFETQQNYQEIDDTTVYVKFKINGLIQGQIINMLVWTTTPWTLPSNLVVAINKNIKYNIVKSNDQYYLVAESLTNKVFTLINSHFEIIKTLNGIELIGVKYIPPFNSYPISSNIIDKSFKIIHSDFVTEQDGTGIVHIAPAYGEEDYDVCIANGIISKTDELFMSIDDEGFFLPNIKSLEDLGGMFYKNHKASKDSKMDINTSIITKLKEKGELFAQNKYRHSYPFCWRSDTPLMYRAVKSWFVNVESIKDRMVELNKEINWIPGHVGNGRFHQWLLQAKDWCIARNRYWGTPIPIWVNINDSSDYVTISSAQQLETLANLPKDTIYDIHRDKIDHIIFSKDNKTYKRISDVFDCIASGSYISLSNDRSIRIEDIENYNVSVLSFKQNDNINNTHKNIIKSKCLAFTKKGIRKCIELTFEDGRVLQCTPEHKILVLNNNIYEWIEAQHIETNKSKIITSIKYPVMNLNVDDIEINWKITFGDYELKYNTFDERLKSNTFARLLGYILTDGSFQNHTTTDQISGTFLIANINDANTIANDIKLLCNVKPNINYCKKSNTHIIYAPKQLLNAFLKVKGITIGRKINQPATLPEFLLAENCPKDVQREFISGMFGGDGICPRVNIDKQNNYKFMPIQFVASKTGEIDSLKNQFKIIIDILKKFNINHVKINGPYQTSSSKKNNGKKYELLLTINNNTDIINFYENIGFSYSSSKQIRLEICATWKRMLKYIYDSNNKFIDKMYELMTIGKSMKESYDEVMLNESKNIYNNQFLYNYKISYEQIKCYIRQNLDASSNLHCGISLKQWLLSIGAHQLYYNNDKPIYSIKNDELTLPSYNLTVIDKKIIGNKNVYDLTIDETHSFLANGIVVHNCWFESGSMPYASIGYPYKTNKINLPADFIAEGIDQTRGWFYTLLVISTAIFDKIPFKNVIVNGLILAADGKKMSKRLKNYPDPMDIVNKYGSDALRLYLLSTPAAKGESVKFNEQGVYNVVKDVIIPLKNSIQFYTSYEQLFKLKYPSESINKNIFNPLDCYAIKYIGSQIKELKNNLNDYLIPNAIKILYDVIEMLNNQYIKFNRSSLKGKGTIEQWKSSLYALRSLLSFLIINIAPFLPFFSEYAYRQLNPSTISIHLKKLNDFKLPSLNQTQNIMADEMIHVLNIIKQVITLRTKNNIKMKIPLEKLLIRSSNNVNQIISKYSNFILDELNVLDIDISEFNWTDVNIEFKPNFNEIKEVYTDIESVINCIKQLDNTKLSLISIIENGFILIGKNKITKNMLNIIIKPIQIPNYIAEYQYCNSNNYCVYINSTISPKLNNIIYARTLATRFQKMKKEFNIKPTDNVLLGYCGKTEYDISGEDVSNVILKICGMIPIHINDDTNINVLYKSKLYIDDSEEHPEQNIDLILYE